MLKFYCQQLLKYQKSFYSGDDKPTPKSILQLHNCMWVHHELCKDLFSTRREITYQKLFGAYLHSLLAHAPRQYEIICLRSVNTENQERMFQQAKKTATNTTNRRPENVIPPVMLRVQAKQLSGKLSTMFRSSETAVKRVCANIPSFNGTAVTTSFINLRIHSWQAHLQCISSYLVFGEVVWWKENVSGYLFLDGDNDPEYQVGGPTVLHFRDSNIQDVINGSYTAWRKSLRMKSPSQLDLLEFFMMMES